MFSDYSKGEHSENQNVLIITTNDDEKSKGGSLVEKPLQTFNENSSLISSTDYQSNKSLKEPVVNFHIKKEPPIKTISRVAALNDEDQSFLDNFISKLRIFEGKEKIEKDILKNKIRIIKNHGNNKKFSILDYTFRSCDKRYVLAFNTTYYKNEKDAGFLTTLETTDLSDLMIESPCEIFKRFYFSKANLDDKSPNIKEDADFNLNLPIEKIEEI